MAQPDLIGIVVQDMAAALEFYRILGLEIPAEADAEQHVEVTLSSGIRIAWDTYELMKSIHSEWREPVGHRMVLAFKCESPAEVDALYHQALGKGFPGYKAPWDAFWGQRYAVLIDPDDNLVDLFAPLE
jgi:catechol 2,3-dioxygenase-like lactoylglutathione lyase family enzyme